MANGTILIIKIRPRTSFKVYNLIADVSSLYIKNMLNINLFCKILLTIIRVNKLVRNLFILAAERHKHLLP